MKVLVVYYSLYGHVFQMAQAVRDGVHAAGGMECTLRRAAEFEMVEGFIAGNEVASAVRQQQKDIAVCTHEDLQQADAIIWGSPTRFGNMCAQMKQVFDSSGTLWLAGALEGKPTGVFTSTGSTHGGQETTLLTMIIPLIHLGMIIVGVPYSTPGLAHAGAYGGTPYGPSTVAGLQGEMQPQPQDLEFARALGKRVADVTRKLRG